MRNFTFDHRPLFRAILPESIRAILSSLSVAGIVALSIWHAFQFYHQRINQPHPDVRSVKMELQPIQAPPNHSANATRTVLAQ